MCRNWKLWIGLGVAAVAVAVVAPNLRVALPFLLVAACPTMRAMAGGAAFASRRRQGSGTAPGSGAPDGLDEMARLRAEVAELRDRVER